MPGGNKKVTHTVFKYVLSMTFLLPPGIKGITAYGCWMAGDSKILQPYYWYPISLYNIWLK